MITIWRPLLGQIILLSLLFSQQAFAVMEIDGSGATFPQPIMQEWITAYESMHPIKVHYKGVGSAEGIKNITARTVDFALTDIGLTRSELSQDDLLQFPLVAGGITPVVNLPNIPVGSLQLSGEVLADIFLGKVAYWDDASIRNLNPALNLSHLPIRVMHRQDGSGTTFTFTNYLSKVSSAWERTLGVGSSLQWPVGEGVAGNEGMAKAVAAQEGAIGYVEYLAAERFKLSTVRLKNKEGVFLAPNPNAFAQAFQQAQWKRDSYYESLTNLPGAQSWPIVAVSYVLVHRTSNDYEDAKNTLSFFDWILTNAKNNNSAYIVVSDPALIKRIKASWKGITDSKGNSVLK